MVSSQHIVLPPLKLMLLPVFEYPGELVGALGELGVAPEACARLASVAASGAADTTAFVRHYKAINMAGAQAAESCALPCIGAQGWTVPEHLYVIGLHAANHEASRHSGHTGVR